MGVSGTMSIYPRQLAGTSPAELEEMLIAKTQPAFSAAELTSLRTMLGSFMFEPAKKKDTFKHSAFECEAHLTPTCLWFETASDFDAMMTVAEVAGTIADEAPFAMFDSSEGTWTPAKPGKAVGTAKPAAKAKSPAKKSAAKKSAAKKSVTKKQAANAKVGSSTKKSTVKKPAAKAKKSSKSKR